MTTEEVRNLKPGQWVEVQVLKDATVEGATDWLLLQQVTHGGVLAYFLDPLARLHERHQRAYYNDYLLRAGPMMNKPSWEAPNA